MAKTTPGEFIRQVRTEAMDRVHWPTGKQTLTTGIMVMIMTGILAIFFFAVDAAFSSAVRFLLSNLAG